VVEPPLVERLYAAISGVPYPSHGARSDTMGRFSEQDCVVQRIHVPSPSWGGVR
jgi:hypothetical protein